MAASVLIAHPAPPLAARYGRARGRPRGHAAASPLQFAAAPALLPACAFALGIVFPALHWLSPAWLVPGCVLLGCLAVLSGYRAPRVLPVALAALFAVLGCLAAELQPPIDPQHQLALLAAEDGQQTVTGAIVRMEAPHHTIYKALFHHKGQEEGRDELTERVDLRLSSERGPDGHPVPLTGGLRLSVYATAGTALPALRCGTTLTATLPLHAESRYRDPGVWDAGEYMRGQGIGATGTAEAGHVRILSAGKASFPCLLHLLQSRASEQVMSLPDLPAMQRLPSFLQLSAADSSMLTAMLTGDRSFLQHSTRTGFERTGSFHLLVVSGMHLAIFSGVILLLARSLRLPRVAATALTLALSLGYAVFTGFGEPVQRSLAMVTLFLLGRLLFRERYALQALGLAALLLMATNPRALSGSSLQMTLLTVVAIGGLAAPLAERSFAPYLHGAKRLWLVAIDASLPPRVAQFRVSLRLLARHLEPLLGRALVRHAVPSIALLLLRALELLVVSVLVELVMALPMAMYFHRVTILGLPVNFLIVPFLGLLLPAAMLCFATLLLAPALAVVPGAFTAALLHIVSGIVNFFAGLRMGDYRLPAPPGPRVAVWVLLLVAAVWLVRGRGRWGPALAASLTLAAAVLAVAPQPVRHRAGALQVSVIDVGQGDAILIITPDGKTMLVDAGGVVGAAPDSRFDIGEEVVSPALWAQGIRRLDAVAISHAHEDHIGGMAAVLANFQPRVLLVGNNPLSHHYAALLAQAAAEHIPVEAHRQDDVWQFGRATKVEALWPSRAYVPRAEPTNNDSLVLRMLYGNTSVLLEGDAQALAETGMLRAGLPHTDLLKVGHHGSLSSSIPPFLAALGPGYGAISCGRRNFYGHPKPATLDKLQAAHVRTFRTDTLGETDFFLDGKRVTAAPWAASQP